MAVMMGKLYTALRAANVAEDKAREAAEEVAGYESRFDAIDARIGKVETNLAVLKWMVGSIGGINIALTITVLSKLLSMPTGVHHP